jgi:outer membrane cobalamin receptor
LYYQRIGNTLLKPENAEEGNIGVTYTSSNTGLIQSYGFSADGYYNYVRNKIVAIPTAYVWKMQNHGKVDMWGTDITASCTFAFSKNILCDWSLNYTYQKAIDVTNSNDKNYRDQLPYTPVHSGNSTIFIRTPWLNLGYTLLAVGERYESGQNIKTNLIDGYTEQSVTLSRTFKISNSSYSLAVSVLNFTNEQYEVVRYYPMPGRSFKIVLKWEL